MKLLLCLAVLALASVPAAADVNVTGNWSGTFTMQGPNGQTKDGTALLVLKQTGSEITGTVGPDESERIDIKKGTIDGNKITIECSDGEHQMLFTLVLADDRISGDVRATDAGDERRAKLDVKRTK